MSFSPLSIRRATAQDAVRLADLGARTFRDAFGADNDPEDMARYVTTTFSPEQIAKELAVPAATFLLGYQGDRLVGYTKLQGGEAPACVAGATPLELVRIYVERYRPRRWAFQTVGSHTFVLGADHQKDLIMERPLGPHEPL